MKRYSQHEIEVLLDKFMDGQTTVEEEALLAEYFRSHDVPDEWEDYRAMFGYFDNGMESGAAPVQKSHAPLSRLIGRRWWGIAAAACITAAIVGIALRNRPQTTPLQQPAVTAQTGNDTLILPPVVEVEPQQLAKAIPEHPVERPVRPAPPARPTNRNLKAENAKLARENERLQRELEDLRRRAFIIDMEANGFKAVMGEDGRIVFIDMEQEIENEFNHQSTNNIPEI